MLFKVIFYLQTIWIETNPLKKNVLDYDEFFVGNVWAQEWAQTYNMTVPHPNKASVDVSPTMVAQVSWVAVKVFYVEKWVIRIAELGPRPQIASWPSENILMKTLLYNELYNIYVAQYVLVPLC